MLSTEYLEKVKKMDIGQCEVDTGRESGRCDNMNCRADAYKVLEGQMENIDEALDTIMIIMHILKNSEERNGQLLVSAEALASALSLAYGAIAETVDEVREAKLLHEN